MAWVDELFGESREHREGREALVWGAGARLRSLPAFRGARRRRSIVERVLEVFREPEKGGYRRRSSLELGSRVTPEAWPDPELAVASFFPEIGRLAPDDSHRAA